MADKFLPNISETTQIFNEKSPIPGFLSPEQIEVFTQLIKDNPVGYEDNINLLKDNSVSYTHLTLPTIPGV